MPSEVKQRKKSQKQGEEVSESSNCRDEAQKTKAESGEKQQKAPPGLDWKAVMCSMSLLLCGALSWMMLQHNQKFSQMEEKLRSLQGETSQLSHMEEEVARVSEKLAASESDLQAALSSSSVLSSLSDDVSSLNAAVAAVQSDETLASLRLQDVNARFLNVTETWRRRLALVDADLVALQSESRDARAAAMQRLNEAERRAAALAVKLQELEDATRRNANALDSTETQDAKRAQEQLDWNTKQVQKLEEQLGALRREGAELSQRLQELLPRARECEERLPEVEEAVRSILRLGAELSAAERRLEEATLQLLGGEDAMMKVTREVVRIRQEMDAMLARHSIRKMKDELSTVKEAVLELTMALKEGRGHQEEEEEWEEPTEPPQDDLTL